MKALIIILIFISLLQTTILPLDLILIILICRSFIRVGRENLLLAFIFGLLISHLSLTPVGLYSILYLILVSITQTLSKSRFSNLLTAIALGFIFLLANEIVSSILRGTSLQIFPKVLIESILSVPIFYFLKMWEERFVARGDIKLKI